MKKYIPSFKKKYEEKLKIINNKLVYMNDNVTEAEKDLFNKAGISSDEKTQIYYLDENNQEKVLEVTDGTISETTYTSQNIAKEKITKVIIGSSCTKIGSSAFENCASLESITADTTNQVPIAGDAFKNCANLKRIKITNCEFGDYTASSCFSNCPNLIEAEIGSKEHLVTSLIVNPFLGCTNEELVIKVYMEKDNSYIDKLQNLKRNNNATVIVYNSNGEETSIIVGLKYKGKNIAWESLSEFEGIKDADKITEIRSNAFADCTELKITKLPANLETIENSAFKNCEKIKITEIPKTVTSIGSSAFENCASLESITADTTNQVPIGGSAFKNCANLKRIKITNCKFGNYTVSSCFSNCPNLIEAEIGSKEHLLTSLIVSPFTGCTNEELVIKVYMEKDSLYDDRINNLKRYNNATVIVYNSNGEQIN